MTNKKKILIAALAVVAVAALYLFLHVDGKKYFDFSAVDETCRVYVIRNDHNISEFVDDEHLTQHRKYLMDENTKQQLFGFIADATYRRHIDFNVFTFVPGVSMHSVSSSDPVDYRIVVEDQNGNELMNMHTCGCDYIRPDGENSRYLKITDGKWGQKLEAILEKAQLADTYFY